MVPEIVIGFFGDLVLGLAGRVLVALTAGKDRDGDRCQQRDDPEAPEQLSALHGDPLS